MRYYETREQSAELLRLTLPLMSQQAAAFHPQSYTIWYEHSAGINPRLTNVLEQRLSQNTPLNDEEVWRLYVNFVVARDAESMERIQQRLKAVLDDTSTSATNAGIEASQFSQTLTIHKNQLMQPLPVEHLPTVVTELLADTERMRRVTEDLVEQLDRQKNEVQELTEQLERAEHQAKLDPLTGIFNRRGFEQQLQAPEPGSSTLRRGVVLVADIDRFKQINDNYGHVLGDKVIRTVAQIIRGNIKGRDVAARIGGEEFAIFLPETSVRGAVALAEQIRATMAGCRIRRSGLEQPIAQVTLSVGIAEAGESDTLEAVLDRADRALYEAKRNGRNRVWVDSASSGG